MVDDNAVAAPVVAFNEAAYSQDWQAVTKEADFQAVQPSLSNNFAISAEYDHVPADPVNDMPAPEVTIEVEFDNDQFLMDVDNAAIMQSYQLPEIKVPEAGAPQNDGLFGAVCGLVEEVASVQPHLSNGVSDVVADNNLAFTPESPAPQPTCF